MPTHKKSSGRCRSARRPIVSLSEVTNDEIHALTYLDEKAWLALTPEQQKEGDGVVAPAHREDDGPEEGSSPARRSDETATATTLR
jgi:hypothetical protein